MRLLSLLIMASTAVVLTTLSHANDATFPAPSPAEIARADPLHDTIVATADGQPIDADSLYDRMAQADVVYLGEQHGNPRHHELQLQALRALLNRGKQPAIGFEFFSQEQTAYLQDYTQKHDSYGRDDLSNQQIEEKLRFNLGWGPERDLYWPFYFRPLQFARKYQLDVFGADLPKGLKRRITRVGAAGLTALERDLLNSTHFSDDAYQSLMEQVLIDAHCGWNDPELINRLYQTWLARNDAMAQAITSMGKSGTNQPVVVILGAGHTRHNMGVVERVQYLWPQAKQVNLAYQELAQKPQAASAYFDDQRVVQAKRFDAAFDYFWFTPATSYEDPCELFKEQLQRHAQTQVPAAQ